MKTIPSYAEAQKDGTMNKVQIFFGAVYSIVSPIIMLFGGDQIHGRLWNYDGGDQIIYYIVIILFFILVEGSNVLVIKGTTKVEPEHETAGCITLFISIANFIMVFIVFGFWAGGM